jgi:hypothetical protein
VSTPLDVSVTEHRTFESSFARPMFLELFAARRRR